ncbi:MAG: sulfotransferase family protein [Pseudomonadota bacterium]
MSYASKSWSENWTNFSVLRHSAFDGFLVTSKNSGTHWVKYMFAVALADTFGVPRPRYFSENAVRPYIGWPKDAPVFDQLPRLAFSHTIPHRLLDWPWSRALSKPPPYALCIRHPMSILASHFAKWEYDIQVDWLTYLHGDPSGAQYRCDLYWLARFWNRWGEIEARHPASILRVQYEETRQDPRTALLAIAAHWDVDLAPEAVEAALAAGTKEAMADKVDPAGEPNVLQRRDTSLDDLFQGEALDIYRDIVRQRFKHDLGYDLMQAPD